MVQSGKVTAEIVHYIELGQMLLGQMLMGQMFQDSWFSNSLSHEKPTYQVLATYYGWNWLESNCGGWVVVSNLKLVFSLGWTKNQTKNNFRTKYFFGQKFLADYIYFGLKFFLTKILWTKKNFARPKILFCQKFCLDQNFFGQKICSEQNKIPD